MSSSPGSLRILTFRGIEVFVHWSWAVAAIFLIRQRFDAYDRDGFAMLEYLALFAIVILHEFGHALACRSVGGHADRIILWPLGGLALVQPPPRPGAWLWSIAAGPLVNVALLPLTFPFTYWYWHAQDDPHRFLANIGLLNLILLVFNLLPIYPLDGGQIVRSLLWFIVGAGRSLIISGVIGIVGAAGLGVWGASRSSPMMILIAVFAVMQSWAAIGRGRLMPNTTRAASPAARCPVCGHPPPEGVAYACNHCQRPVDPLATGGTCPTCGVHLAVPCVFCGNASDAGLWSNTPMRMSR